MAVAFYLAVVPQYRRGGSIVTVLWAVPTWGRGQQAQTPNGSLQQVDVPGHDADSLHLVLSLCSGKAEVLLNQGVTVPPVLWSHVEAARLQTVPWGQQCRWSLQHTAWRTKGGTAVTGRTYIISDNTHYIPVSLTVTTWPASVFVHARTCTFFRGQQAQSPLSLLQQVEPSEQATESLQGTTATTNNNNNKITFELLRLRRGSQHTVWCHLFFLLYSVL